MNIFLSTCNAEKYIEQLLESLSNQTYSDWKLLVRDDGSQDGTVRMIEERSIGDGRIVLIRDELGNIGPC